MRFVLSSTIAALAFATPVYAQTELEKGFAGALRGCEEWILNPGSWANGPAPFISAVGLGDKMGLVSQVDDAALPPVQFRQANHYWRINSTTDAGYILVVSDQVPMCHITGGGDADLQPIVESVLVASAFTKRWKRVSQKTKGDIISTEYLNQEDSKFFIVISRANKPGLRRDRVQVLATGIFKTAK